MKPERNGNGSDHYDPEPDDEVAQPPTSTAPETDNSSDEYLEWLVDEAMKDSFPASDPPCWTLGRSQSARGEAKQPTEDDDENSTDSDTGA